MLGWRTKLVFLLVVYFAGFATAIYFLVPVPEGQDVEFAENSLFHSAIKSDDLAKSFNAGIHKCIDFGEDALSHTGKFIKQKMDDYSQDDS